MFGRILASVKTSSSQPASPTSAELSPTNASTQQKHSNDKSSHDSAGHEDNSSEQTNKKQQVRKLRMRAWILLGVSETILALLVMVQLLTFNSFLQTAVHTIANEELQLLVLNFGKKFDRTVSGLSSLAQDSSIVQFVEGDSSLRDDLKANLGDIRDTRKIQYVSIFDANGRYLLSSNDNNRTGEYWDLGGVTSTVLSGAPENGQYKTTVPITYAEYANENPPATYDGRLAYLSGQTIDYTKGNSMVRLIAYPVNSSTTDTPIGVVVFGNVMSQETTFLEESVGVLGNGFGSVMILDPDNHTVDIVVEYLFADNNQVIFELEISQSVRLDIMQKTFASPNGYSGTLTVLGSSYAIAAVRTDPASLHGTNYLTSRPTNGIILRGRPLEGSDSIYTEVVTSTLALMAGCLVTDVIGMLVAVRLFIDPIDRLLLYIKLKAYEKYAKLLKEISMTRRFIWRVGFFFSISALFLIFIITLNNSLLKYALQKNSSASAQAVAMDVTFKYKMDEMYWGSEVLSKESVIQDLLQNSSDTTAYNLVKTVLKAEAMKRQIEYVTVVDSNMMILANAFNDRRGETFNPDQISSYTLAKEEVALLVTTMNASDLYTEGSPRFIDPLIAVPANFTSAYHVYATNATMLVRFIVHPLYSNSSVDPIGLLIYGDVLNGKLRVSQRIFSAFNEGYDATYLKDPYTGNWNLITSAFQPLDSSADKQYDVPLGQDGLDLIASHTSRNGVTVGNVAIRGNPYEAAVTPIEASGIIDCSGNFVPVSDYRPRLFSVRAVSSQKWKDIESAQVAIEVSTIFLQLLSSIGISYMLYRPVQKFVAFLKTEFQGKEVYVVPVRSGFNVPEGIHQRSGNDSTGKETHPQVKD